MKKILQFSLALLLLIGNAVTGVAQNAPSTHNLVDIALNGIPVVVDGQLADWDDASFTFMSQDSPFFLQITNGQPVQGIPASPADFSAHFAIKMDAENIYFAARVRDEGVALFGAPATPNLAFDFDHVSLYLGLYDIGILGGSPHLEGPTGDLGNFKFINPVSGEEFDANRHYRVAPGTDNTQSTRGADYQLLLRAIDHDPATFNSRAHTYAGAYVDTTLGGTVAAVVLWADEKGYNVEWKIPFASLAGKISKGTGSFKDFDWPLFVPSDGMIIPFDVDITDRDVAGGLNNYLRAGQYPSLWRDAHRFGMRGRIVDLAARAWDRPNSKLYIDYKPTQNVVIDANMSDWADAMFYGNSQDHPHFRDVNGGLIQGTPSSPSDFSYYLSMKMDDDNLYVGLIVRDQGTPMIETPSTPNLAFNYDHLSVYLGLFDLGNTGKSPHLEGPTGTQGSFKFINPVTGEEFDANRHYRIGPGTDNTESTRGPDFQMLIRALEHDPATFDSRAHTYNGAYVDTTIPGTLAAGALWNDENGYFLEWKIPFEVLSGKISRTVGSFPDFQWPRFEPAPGKTIVWDADVTDSDAGDRGLNRFMRVGRNPALWRDSFNFGMRGNIVEAGTPTSTSIDPISGIETQLPTSIQLSQNYPNPFNPTTTIQFALPQAQQVRLSVFNMLGQEVAVLTEGVRAAGEHTVSFNASALSSGMYIYRLSSGNEIVTRKMLLVK